MIDKETRNAQLAKEIVKGILDTSVFAFNSVKCSDITYYPVIGIGNWVGDRADSLLDKMDGGIEFIDRSYSSIVNENDKEALKELLNTPKNRAIQLEALENDALHFVERITHHDHLTNHKCIVFAGLWGILGIENIVRFTKILDGRRVKIDKNDLESLCEAFIAEFRVTNSHVTMDDPEEVEERANTFYNYVMNL